MIYLLCAVAGYLFGSLMFACLITKRLTGKDIRTLGVGNPGAGNVFRTVSRPWGVATFFLDMGKGLIPMLAGFYIFRLSWISVGLIGLGAVWGHRYPVFFGFKGGRSGAVIIGVYAVLTPIELAVSMVVTLVIAKFLKRDRTFLVPLILYFLSASISMFTAHEPVKKIVVMACFVSLLIINRDKLPAIVAPNSNKADAE
jgi:glycerol-3-phosphate acyltransferase PlsY